MGSDGPLKVPQFEAAPTVFDANLLTATGDGKSVAVLRLHLKQLRQGAHPAEGRTLVVDAAAPAPCVVVNAPTIGTHHGEVLLALFLAEGLEGFRTLLRIEAATGAAGADATPAMTTHHATSIRRGQRTARARKVAGPAPAPLAMGFIDFHLIANFAALALITLAGPAVIFILFYRRGAL